MENNMYSNDNGTNRIDGDEFEKMRTIMNKSVERVLNGGMADDRADDKADDIAETVNNDPGLSDYLPHVTFEAIPIKDLVTDVAYQRQLSEKHIRRMAANFDAYQINPVKVSRRDGINYVFNGQHTMEVVATVSGSRDTPVWCMVYDDLVYKREANIFANQQKYAKKLTPYEIFVANMESGNDEQLLINELVESYSLHIAGMSNPGCICAVGALEKIYEDMGYEILSRTLRLIVGIWEGEKQSLGSNIIKGMAKLLDCYGTKIVDDIFIEKLETVSAQEIIRSAKERKGGVIGYAEAMLAVYNRKSRSPLSIDALYSRKKNRRTNADSQPDVTDQPHII